MKNLTIYLCNTFEEFCIFVVVFAILLYIIKNFIQQILFALTVNTRYTGKIYLLEFGISYNINPNSLTSYYNRECSGYWRSLSICNFARVQAIIYTRFHFLNAQSSVWKYFLPLVNRKRPAVLV